MIPKVIHYCWFGGKPLPKTARKCISSWKKHLPDYEVKEWNESNFDVNMVPFTAEAYKAKKYAFVSDYARFWILHKYGGIYFDVDVQVIKSFDDIVTEGAFMGFERNIDDVGDVAAGLGMGCPAGHPFISHLLDLYNEKRFILENGKKDLTPIGRITTAELKKEGLVHENKLQKVAGFTIYPTEYFCPMTYITLDCKITSNTRSIHLYNGSWMTPVAKLENHFYSHYPITRCKLMFRLFYILKKMMGEIDKDE